MQAQSIHQKYLKKAGLIAMVTVLGMAPPLSTDMYMPSLPKMAEYFDALPALVNMTMVAFFVFMSIGMLIMGPLSDRSGRKRILIISLLLYLVKFLCVHRLTLLYYCIISHIVKQGNIISQKIKTVPFLTKTVLFLTKTVLFLTLEKSTPYYNN